MDHKKTKAPLSTITNNRKELQKKTQNIFEVICIVSKRANQISVEIKEDLVNKLDQFATYNYNLQEVFENKEQIEVSKFYEKLPKSHSIATQEWLDDKVYFRKPEKKE